MVGGGLLLSVTLILFAVWLQRTEHVGWPGEEFDGKRDLDQRYRRQRMRSRRVVNFLIGLCGVLILIASLSLLIDAKFIDGRLIFVAAWLTVIVVLFVVVMLAMLDVFRTYRYEKDKLRDLRRQSIGDDD